MNIQDAKEEIKRTLRIYTQKNPDGTYRIPTEKQRPILLIGPPGIGKTAIMKQIAAETGMGLVSYTMTHHTRQSAIGLPFIKERTFQGRTYSITEYTMSEIISSLYIYMEETGHQNGILFLDEINCVSETLSPVMLQLLQNKTFGNHPLPEGWLIVAAGNPPEYNKSVRELDMVTLDRVKNMDIEADLAIWQNYAVKNHVHPAVRGYLRNYPDHFYRIEDDARGRHFVTARGWEDLSVVLTAYEENQESATESLFIQYLQHDAIAHSFALFYEYFADAYRRESGRPSSSHPDQVELQNAMPAEVLAYSAALFQQIQNHANLWLQDRDFDGQLAEALRGIGSDPLREEYFVRKRQAMAIKRAHSLLSSQEEFLQEDILRKLEELQLTEFRAKESDAAGSPESILAGRQEYLKNRENILREKAMEIIQRIDQAYQVLEHSSIADAALLYLTADLAADESCTQLLLTYPSRGYNIWSARLLSELQSE